MGESWVAEAPAIKGFGPGPGRLSPQQKDAYRLSLASKDVSAQTAAMKTPLGTAKQVLAMEAQALLRLHDSLGEEVEQAVRLMAACRGRVVVTGMGKAGHVGKKIAATLASTGRPAFFLHPAEAVHGDLGQVKGGDVVLALSNSGRTGEIVALLDPLKAMGCELVAMTARGDSPLGRAATVCIATGKFDEADPLGLAPTTSSTVMLALGDALAMAVAQTLGTTPEDFARNHPGGSLGRRLRPVSAVMRQGEMVPRLRAPAKLKAALTVMGETPGRPGCALLVDGDGHLLGIFTDGDLRRLVGLGEADLNGDLAAHVTAQPTTLHPEDRVQDAEAVLSAANLDQAPVLDGQGRLVGLVDVQDLLGNPPDA